MTTNLKALVVVLVLAIAVFTVAKPICLRFMAASDFTRRRNIWLLLTAIAFTSPNFWLFAVVAMLLLFWGGRKDSNPIALYVLVMHVIPPTIGFEIPVVGIDHLFELNFYRLLSIFVLIPAGWRALQSTDRARSSGSAIMDILVLAYGGLQLILLAPYQSITNSARHGFLFFIDAFLVYFVVSRTCSNRRAILDAMASIALACVIMAPMALFEMAKGWLLYTNIAVVWNDPTRIGYIFRDDALRAQVSVGHPLPLGYLLATGFGFWLYLRTRVQPTLLNKMAPIWMWMGLVAAYSRGPWVAAVVIFFAYLLLGPHGLTRSIKATLLLTAFAGLILVSPIGNRVVESIPFIGTIGSATVTYREQLAMRSWQLIQEHPFFGDQLVIMKMQSLRQGEGIVDLMNGYAAVALFYGVVGLSLFLAPFFIGMWNVHRIANRYGTLDSDVSLLGISLLAGMVGMLFMLATGGFGGSVEKIFWVLTGLAAGYTRLGRMQGIVPATRSHEAAVHSQRSLRQGWH